LIFGELIEDKIMSLSLKNEKIINAEESPNTKRPELLISKKTVERISVSQGLSD
jgi:hypothetical protein